MHLLHQSLFYTPSNLLAASTYRIQGNLGRVDFGAAWYPFVSCVVLVLVERAKLAELRASLLADKSARAATRAEHGKSLALRLLGSLCDVVAELDHEICFAIDCPKLRALLMHGVGSPTLRGRSFADLLPEEERGNFVGRVLAKSGDDSSDAQPNDANALCLHTNLCCAGGTRISAQVF